MSTLIQKNVDNILFALGIAISIFITFILFFVWNKPTTNYISDSKPLENYSVDKCNFSNNGVNISGWAFVPNENFNMNQVFLIKTNGDIKGLMTGLTVRDDVSKTFSKNGMYSKSGFVSSLFEKDAKDKFKKEILITSTTQGGVTYATKFKCL